MANLGYPFLEMVGPLNSFFFLPNGACRVIAGPPVSSVSRSIHDRALPPLHFGRQGCGWDDREVRCLTLILLRGGT